MAKRRMNSTAALVVDIDPGSSHEHHSRSTRKIENGYLHSETHETNGKYEHREHFSRGPKPMGGKPEGSVGPEGLSGAIAEALK